MILMRIVSWNVNGIRAAIRKGLDEFIEQMNPDVLMLQEVRALPEQLPKDWDTPEGMEIIWHPAEKKGYSGVSTWSKGTQVELSRGRGESDEDLEGRVLSTEYNGVTFINVYLPSGSAKIERQLYKEKWMDEFFEWVQPFISSEKPVIIAGDLNIAHTENDIWNPVGNKNSSGFLPNEREWFTKLLESGWNDVCRDSFGETKGPYSWWSNRGNARMLDRGWRIDYFLANEAANKMVKQANILREGGLKVSDHAPIILDLE